MSSLGDNPTTFLHLISGNIHGGPGEVTITEEEAHYDVKSFSNFIINENKVEMNMKNSISGIIKLFNISNDTEINALKYSYEEENNFQQEMNSRVSKRTYRGTLKKGEYYAVYAEMKLYVVNVENENGQVQGQRIITPTGIFYTEVVTRDGFKDTILDESWGTLIRKWDAPLKFYKREELVNKIAKRSIPNISVASIEDKTAKVTSEGSSSLDKNTQLSGINITNDLSQGDLSDIEIYSVISEKVASTFSYVTNWSYVDVEKNQKAGLWQSRQIVTSSCRIPLQGGQEKLKCSLRFHEDYRHYWQFKCRIDGKSYRINKNNAQANLWDMDNGKIPRFILLEEGDYVRINMMFNSGTAHFYLEEY